MKKVEGINVKEVGGINVKSFDCWRNQCEVI